MDAAYPIDHLRDTQVHDQAGERQRLPGRKTVQLAHQLDHLDCCDRRRFVKASVEAERQPAAGQTCAVQGDGEVAGPALNCPMEVEMEFRLHPELRLTLPRARLASGWKKARHRPRSAGTAPCLPLA